MSMALDIFCLVIFLAIPTAVALSTWMGVGGWVLPISVKVVRMGTAAWPLRKRTPYLSSVAEAMIFQIILHKTWTKPLRRGVYSVKVTVPGLGSLSK